MTSRERLEAAQGGIRSPGGTKKHDEVLAEKASAGLCSGENANAWRGSYVSGYGYGWTAIREAIQIRDKHLCQLCSSIVNLTCHHIDHDPDNMDNTNLITLCSGCNGTVNGNQDYWREMLEEKIREIYKEELVRV